MNPMSCVLLGLLLVAAPSALAEGDLLPDDECEPGQEGQCALSALQRRAVVREGDGQATEAEANWTWGSCAVYGCSGYRRHQPCQCNDGCQHHGNCCFDFYFRCHAPAAPPAPAPQAGPGGSLERGGLMTLYHQTSPEACASILTGGFRIGHGGWCGKGIYFATSPQATKTKAITPGSGVGCMLEASVNVGNVLRYPCCRYCGGKQDQHVSHSETELKMRGYDSVSMNPGDGDEYIVYDPARVLHVRQLKFDPAWEAHPVKHW